MAIILPVFMMVVMGIIEFGRGMMVGQLVTNSARHGARLAAVDGETNSSVQTAVENFLIDTTGITAADASVTITVTPAPGNPDPANNLAASQPRDVVKVEVKVPYDKVGYIAGSYLKGKMLCGECWMRRE